MSPRGVALTDANVLSAISVSDGKVFFSINVEATEARAWESVRAEAEAAVRGIPEKPQLNDERKMIPIARFGLAIMSIGFLVEEDTAMIWRGPMVMSAITQMLRDVAWGTLDILVVDMPPGTGDAQLTLAQNVPL